jgi:tetratricopeptide (TPR) repeat protein
MRPRSRALTALAGGSRLNDPSAEEGVIASSILAGRRGFWSGLALGVLLAAGIGWYWWHGGLKSRTAIQPDMVAVLRANNRAVGLMERYKYADAVTAFQEVVALAPDWLPGRINLGIALLNSGQDMPADLAKALALFEQVGAEHPDNPYAHFCLGLLYMDQGQKDPSTADEKLALALAHFERVTQIDATDAASWVHIGHLVEVGDSDRGAECYRRALTLDPHLTAAIYGLSMCLRKRDPARQAAALDEFLALKNEHYDGDTRGNLIKMEYPDMGQYACVIGRSEHKADAAVSPMPLFQADERFTVHFAPGVRWATTRDFGSGPQAELRAAVRARFGATMVVVDYNRDGKPDLFLLGAVVENGVVRDLLLRNDGTNGFTDVTREAGLAAPRPSLGCCVGDYDNDGYPDLLITGIGEQHLFHNTRSGKFEDLSALAGLDRLHTVCLGGAFVDLDQDGDLDLVMAQYGATAAEALATLRGQGTPDGGLVVYLNVGEAPPTIGKLHTGKEPMLNTRFRRAFEDAAVLPGGLIPSAALAVSAAAEAVARTRLLGASVPTVGLAVSDLDQDGDLDLLTFADGRPPTLVLNDRLLRFHRLPLPAGNLAALWNGALVLDADRDGKSDLVLVSPDQRPVLLLNRHQAGRKDPEHWFESGATNSPPLLQAQAIDLDLDGLTDVVGISAKHKPVLLHNDGYGLVVEPLGHDAQWPADLVAVTVADFNGDGYPDFVTWSESAGLQVYRNQGNGNHALALELTGRRGVTGYGKIRTCADGMGVQVTAHADDLWTGAEVTTLSAGLGQSCQPLYLGLGRHTQADVVRLRWPEGVHQAELQQLAGPVCRIEETNRKTGSCPLLFAWNGRRFGYITDFLGAGSMGEMTPDGGHRPPRPEESVKIEADQLAPRNGRYIFKIAEPMDEITYLDRLQLVVLDHPADVRVFPDERFPCSGPPPSPTLFAFRGEIFPQKARDHHGHDVTATLAKWDRDTVDDFAHRSWLGYAEEHWVELDFGDRLARFGPHDRLFLCLAGWTDYPYPESIWAATQAGVALQPPTVERLGADGKWQLLMADASFPAGLPRMMTLELTGLLGSPRCVIRLRTNMEVYWDQIYAAPLVETVAVEKGASGAVRATALEVVAATLAARPCMQEYSPDGRQPTIYDYDRLAAVPVARPTGRLTRFGDVTELLRDCDDRFVLFGPGEELTVQFDATGLPALPPGWTRSFVLRTWGYCKDCSPFTDTGGTVEPLPFAAMHQYPYGRDEQYPRDAAHDDYRRLYNTRQIGRNH